MRIYDIFFQTEHCGTALGYYLKIKAISNKQLIGIFKYLWKRSEQLRNWAEISYANAPHPEGEEASRDFDLNYSRLMDLRGIDWMINTPLFDAIYKELRRREIRIPEEIMEAMAGRKWAGVD